MERIRYAYERGQQWLNMTKAETPRTYNDVLNDLAESSSLHGIGKVASSRQLAVKVLWMLLVIGAMVLCGIHLHKLFTTFFSNPVQTSVSMSFGPLKYPAITFCNMNPIRKSRLDKSDPIAKIFGEWEPDEVDDCNTTVQETDLAPVPQQYLNFEMPANWMFDDTAVSHTEPNFRFRRDRPVDYSTYYSYNNYYSYDIYDSSGDSDTETSSLGDNDGDDDYFGFISDGSDNNKYLESADAFLLKEALRGDPVYLGKAANFINDQLNSPRDELEVKLSKFRVAFRKESRMKRITLGHSRNPFIHQATFAGVVLDTSSETLFTTLTTTDYGNCYTMDSPRFIAWNSGPPFGLDVTLNLELSEYMEYLAFGYGVRLVLHTPGTFPLPLEEGLTLSPGTETNIGLRKVRAERMGPPYGECDDGVEFERLYGFNYSMKTCFAFCRTRAIIAACDCIPPRSPGVDLHTSFTRICEYGYTTDVTAMADMKCILETDILLMSPSSTHCKCDRPCSEDVFETTVSSRILTKADYMENNNVNGNLDLEHDRYNFLRFVIYYEDLHYETIAEEAMYPVVRFLSDIGGALCLFLGASVLTFVELLHLLLETVLYFRTKMRQKRILPFRKRIQNALVMEQGKKQDGADVQAE